MTMAHQIWLACLWEAQARKVGNVHPNASFADCTFADFAASAGALAGSLGRPHSSFGKSIYDAVTMTQIVVGRNTNLGISLLLEPLARSKNPREVSTVLEKLTRDDARRVFAAIERANPGGLGESAKYDIRDEPKVTLLEAMRHAADRDLIALQYANGFRDVFELGLPALLEGLGLFSCVEAAIIHCQLAWLCALPDTLIARKNGFAAAEAVQIRAVEWKNAGGLTTPAGRAAGRAFDVYLRSDAHKLNPGTTADLVAACLFVALREGKLKLKTTFSWPVEDWL